MRQSILRGSRRCSAIVMLAAHLVLARELRAETGVEVSAPAIAFQQSDATIRGRVVDETGAALPGATVSVKLSDAHGTVPSAVTDRAGAFTFEHVVPANVVLHVELAGFQPADVTVKGASMAPVTIRLQVSFDEEVTVEGRIADNPLSPDRNANAVEFDPDTLRQLPTEMESPLALVDAFVDPAVAAGGVSFVIDGAEGDASGVPLSAIHRLRVNRNAYSAEFRRPGQGRIEIETEHGSRRFFHGTTSFFVHNSALDARDPFARETPDRDRRLAEGAVGGPLPRSRWSFFASGRHLIDDGSAVVNALTPAGGVTVNNPTAERRTTAFGRADYRRTGRTSGIEYDLFDDRERNRGVGGFKLPEQAFASSERRQRVRVSDHRAVSALQLNDVRVDVVRSRRDEGAAAGGPALVVAGAFTGGPSQASRLDEAWSLQLHDVLVVTRGRHLFRVGGQLKAKPQHIVDRSNFGGTFEFSSLDAFARGAPLLFRIRQGNPDASYVSNDAVAFAEADLRLTDALDFTAGLRYDWQSHLRDRDNVAPRASVAFAPGSRKTVFRAGAGVFYEQMADDAIARSLLFDGSHLHEAIVAEPTFPLPSPIRLDAPGTLWRIDPAARTPSTIQATVAVERTLTRKSSFTAEYLTFRTSNVLRARDVNAPRPGTGMRPDASALNIFQIESSAERSSNALMLMFRGRAGQFKGTMKYTLSRTMDDAGGPFDVPADSFDLASERGRADFDRRHRLNVAGVYGWARDRVRLGGVLTMASRAPFDITTGADDNRDLVTNDRPPGVTRNTGSGPNLIEANLRFTTVFRTPRPPSADPQSAKRDNADNLELNVDLFNAFNRMNAATYVGIQSSPFFGRANAARPARSAQVSLRYRF